MSLADLEGFVSTDIYFSNFFYLTIDFLSDKTRHLFISDMLPRIIGSLSIIKIIRCCVSVAFFRSDRQWRLPGNIMCCNFLSDRREAKNELKRRTQINKQLFEDSVVMKAMMR